MYLKNDFIVVTAGDLVFRSFALTNPQLVLDPTALVGWYDGVGTNRDDVTRPNQWGNFPEPGRKASRTITLTGGAVADTVEDLHTLRDNLMALFSDGGYNDIYVENKSGIRSVNATVTGQPSWIPLTDKLANWKIDFFAPDPRMYGPDQTVNINETIITGGLKYQIQYPLSYGLSTQSTLQYITNSGNVDSWPVFTVTGEYASGFNITDNAGHTVTYNGMVTTQAPVVIDMGRGTAVQNGADRTALISGRDWFSIPAGKTIRPTYTAIQEGTGYCAILYKDTWI